MVAVVEVSELFKYSIAHDAWVFQVIIPCNDHYGQNFSGPGEEERFYRRKLVDHLNQNAYGARMTINEKIAENIFGQTKEVRETWKGLCLCGRSERCAVCSWPLPYSTNMDHAMEVVEKINLEFTLHTDTGTPQEWRASFGTHYAIAETAPHAICLAALKTKGL